MSKQETILKFVDASFGYYSVPDKKILIKNFSGEFKEGEFIAIIGRNGTGKSTFLKSLVRLIPLLNGEIFMKDKSLTQYSLSEYARIVSFVSTDLPRSGAMTVYELVSLGRFPYTNWLGSLTKDDHMIIDKSIESTNLTSLREKPLIQISDGERQRAMIARTLAQDTPIIILDEPTAFLDIPNKFELAGLLAKLSSSGKTIIISTHDTGIALRFPDKLLIINDNFITFGSPEDQVLKGEFRNIFQVPGFHFDYFTAEIEIIPENKRNITVTGSDEVSLIWTKKALKRAGFKMEEKNISHPCIDILTDRETITWKLNYNNIIKEFTSIYELISFIKFNFYLP